MKQQLSEQIMKQLLRINEDASAVAMKKSCYQTLITRGAADQIRSSGLSAGSNDEEMLSDVDQQRRISCWNKEQNMKQISAGAGENDQLKHIQNQQLMNDSNKTNS
ncbi:hypothetical protein F511_13422 [Dorcoceras hygrometricum]|uniref:Uncharacterized protein n=1 Tax=Dorcoceras hygrometricum TaxID=472368 RepID=A0A2Z7AFM6_9LAMI|nr:hypothetical protein F511_13422 [Dorcoceras hygrometricum]